MIETRELPPAVEHPIELPTHADVLRAHDRDLPPAVAQAEELRDFRARHAGDVDPMLGLWRQRADKQFEQWGRATAAKWTPLSTRPTEPIDQDAIDAVVANALAGRELEAIQRHIEIDLRIAAIVNAS